MPGRAKKLCHVGELRSDEIPQDGSAAEQGYDRAYGGLALPNGVEAWSQLCDPPLWSSPLSKSAAQSFIGQAIENSSKPWATEAAELIPHP